MKLSPTIINWVFSNLLEINVQRGAAHAYFEQNAHIMDLLDSCIEYSATARSTHK